MSQDEALQDSAVHTGAPTAYFMRERGSYVPTSLAQGPWGQAVSGHVVGGILGWAVEQAAGDRQLLPARFTVDLLRPTALEPVEVATSIHRDGRRIRLADAVLTQNGTVVARASALFLRHGQQPADQVWSASIAMPPMPAEPDEMPNDASLFIQTYGWGTPSRTRDTGDIEWHNAAGPKYAWLRETKPLIDGEPLTPFVRAAMAGDVTSSLTHWGTGGLHFINADYTLNLSRLPDGPYLGLASLNHHTDSGIAVGVATIFDQRGPIGSGVATALANPGFRTPFR